jgi:ABC-type ATPase involved in cell division
VAEPPKLLLADEHTGNLDPESAACAWNCSAMKPRGTSILLFTHNPDGTCRHDALTMHDGHLRAPDSAFSRRGEAVAFRAQS